MSSNFGPTPTLTLQERNFDCYFYNTCLGKAAARHWDGFTCSHCCLSHIKPEPTDDYPPTNASDDLPNTIGRVEKGE